MRNRIVDRLLVRALDLASQFTDNDGTIPKVNTSALASFGAAVIQTGPKAACALYLGSTKSEAQKAIIVEVLLQLVYQQEQWDNKPETEITEAPETDEGLMTQVIAQADNDETLFKERLFNGVMALKLALRTFTLNEKNRL